MRSSYSVRRAAQLLPPTLLQTLRRFRAQYPPRSRMHLDRRLEPVQRDPFARGVPIDRYYIEQFLRRWNPAHGVGDIRGSVLEFSDTRYASAVAGWQSAGSSTHVQSVDVIDVVPNPQATIHADISSAPHLPDASYDTIICTQVLHYVSDLGAALATLRRLLRPGGVLYVTVPCAAPDFSRNEDGVTEYWRFTSAGLEWLMLKHFPAQELVVESFGNVLATVCFLHGLAFDELSHRELVFHDPSYELVVAARVKLN